MNFLWSLIFLPLNLLFGVAFVWLIKWLLFNKKPRYIFKIRNIFTPGVFPRIKNLILRRIRGAVQDYFDQVDDLASHNGYIYRWEKRVYAEVYDKTEFIDRVRYMPTSVADWIRNAIAFIAKDLSARFLRTFIPYLYEYYEIEGKIDLIEEKIDLTVIESYYNDLFHNFFLVFSLVVFFFIGVLNQIMFLILV